MKAVVQRVSSGKVLVDGKQIASIDRGFVVLLGIGPEDTRDKAKVLAEKISRLRVFEDAQGKMNLSILDVKGGAIVVSQFTLYADTTGGNRPSFINAASPEIAKPLCEYFVECMIAASVPTQSGEFGAHMQVQIQNDGPVTILFES